MIDIEDEIASGIAECVRFERTLRTWSLAELSERAGVSVDGCGVPSRRALLPALGVGIPANEPAVISSFSSESLDG